MSFISYLGAKDYQEAMDKLLAAGLPRVAAKAVLFADAYGMNVDKFQRMISTEYAKIYVNLAEHHRPEGLP